MLGELDPVCVCVCVRAGARWGFKKYRASWGSDVRVGLEAPTKQGGWQGVGTFQAEGQNIKARTPRA